jgi:glycosyltransferase involved in cell wall biosynthesis
MYASLLSGIPFTFTSHANDLFERGILLQQKVERSKFAVTISNYNRQFLIQHHANPDKIQIVRCGIDSQQYTYTPKTQKHTPIKLGSLARLVEKKGMDDFIRALAVLQQEGVDFEADIAGDGPLMDELQTLVAECHLESHVKFRGAIAHSDVPQWLRSLDVFVLACKRDKNGDQDGIPVVLMEAMAIGIPVVSTTISGIPELITSSQTGFLANPGDPHSLAQTLKEVIHFNSLEHITKTAQEYVNYEFDQQVNANRLLALIEAP